MTDFLKCTMMFRPLDMNDETWEAMSTEDRDNLLQPRPGRVRKSEIEAYNESSHKGCCTVWLKTHESYCIRMTVDQIDKEMETLVTFKHN